MNDFGKKILHKYGWKTGDRIGKNDTGLVNPVKASLKFDHTGLGFDYAKEHTHSWWHDVYNSAAKKLDVTKEEQLHSSTMDEEKKRVYSSFTKAAILKGSVEEKLPAKKIASDTSVHVPLDDDALLKACGGRTAHRAAGHGFKLTGKLARVAAQDACLTSISAQSYLSATALHTKKSQDEPHDTEKCKKIKKKHKMEVTQPSKCVNKKTKRE